jgi:hypothetical protein
VTEFKLVNDDLTKLMGAYLALLAKYGEHLKEGRFFVLQFTEYAAEYWINFEGGVQHSCKGKVPADMHGKLGDDYDFMWSISNFPAVG